MELLENLQWLVGDTKSIITTILSTIGIYLTVVIITRINGLRTFAKMSSFDFAITIAIGSIIASTMLSDENSLLKGMVALSALIALQAIVAYLRKRSDHFEKITTNSPILLMDGATILKENLKKNRVTESDLFAKLREANVLKMDQVLAVVLETTGDISVLHSSEKTSVDQELMKGVRTS